MLQEKPSTQCPDKKCHIIFDYNSRIFLSIFYIFVALETGMNFLPNGYERYYFNLTAFPLYLVKQKNNTKTAYRLL